MQISRRQLLVVASTATFVGFSGFSLQALAAELTLPSVGADKKFSAVPVPADPKRLAVLEYSVIENLQVLGLSDRIKAAVQTRNLPWLSALSTDCKLVKSVKSVDIETVSSAKPDLIFISGRISRNIDAFKPIAPTVCLIPNKAEGWKSFRGNFLALAEVFGKKADAEKQLKPLEKRLSALRNKAEGWKSFRGNFLALAEVFGKKADAEKQLKPLEKRLSALRNKAAGERIAVIMMVNGRMMAAPAGGAAAHLGADFGFTNVKPKPAQPAAPRKAPAPGEKPAAPTPAEIAAGNAKTIAELAALKPHRIFVLNKDEAIGMPEPNTLAKAVADQPEWAKLDAVKGHRVHELTHAAWYLADGGLLSMDKMLADAERALGL